MWVKGEECVDAVLKCSIETTKFVGQNFNLQMADEAR
jgi:hypothetical protein